MNFEKRETTPLLKTYKGSRRPQEENKVIKREGGAQLSKEWGLRQIRKEETDIDEERRIKEVSSQRRYAIPNKLMGRIVEEN